MRAYNRHLMLADNFFFIRKAGVLHQEEKKDNDP